MSNTVFSLKERKLSLILHRIIGFPATIQALRQDKLKPHSKLSNAIAKQNKQRAHSALQCSG